MRTHSGEAVREHTEVAAGRLQARKRVSRETVPAGTLASRSPYSYQKRMGVSGEAP